MSVHNIMSRAGELLEEGVSTVVREQRILLSPSIINSLLGYHAPPNNPDTMSPNEAFRLLRPNEPIGVLNFKPITMPNPNRALHYIYSRSIVNKSKNYTHFAQKDYYLLASFLAGQQRNVGEHIFSEMRRFRFSSSRSATIPYPQLVSLILKHHKIWYLEGTERVNIPRFGKTQLTHMGITPPKSKSKAQSQREATPSKGDEAQSSFQGPSPPPSFLNASLSRYISEAVSHAMEGLKKELVSEYEKLVDKMENQVRRLVDNSNSNFDSIFKFQQDTNTSIKDLKNFLYSIFPTTQPEVPPEHPTSTQPESHVLFTYTDPMTTASIDVTFEKGTSSQPTTSTAQPSSPPSEPDPIDASTAMVLYTPPVLSDLTFPQPPSDADKPGEKSL